MTAQTSASALTHALQYVLPSLPTTFPPAETPLLSNGVHRVHESLKHQ